jgi:hypothetical protein
MDGKITTQFYELDMKTLTCLRYLTRAVSAELSNQLAIPPNTSVRGVKRVLHLGDPRVLKVPVYLEQGFYMHKRVGSPVPDMGRVFALNPLLNACSLVEDPVRNEEPGHTYQRRVRVWWYMGFRIAMRRDAGLQELQDRGKAEKGNKPSVSPEFVPHYSQQ